MTSPIDVSVVLPAYLEEENLRLLLPRLKAVSEGMGVTFEILVVDTVTPLDSTPDVCRQQGAAYLARVGSNSYGSAIRTGIRAAQGRHIVFMDADGSHPPEFLPKLFEFRNDYDVVVASRYAEGGHAENPRHLVWMSRVLNWSYAIVLNLRCKDVSNSFKLYRGEQLKSLKLRSDNFDIVEEILFKLNRRFRVRIKEVPFTFKKRMFGQTKRNLVLFMLTYLVTLIRLRFSRD